MDNRSVGEQVFGDEVTPGEESGGEPPATDTDMDPPSVTADFEWPEAVRNRVAEIAAAALGAMPAALVPNQLRAVARFAPAKRARLGCSALINTLVQSTPFRASVLEWCREHRPGVLDIDAADAVVAATANVLLGRPAAVHYAELINRRQAEQAAIAEREQVLSRDRRLSAELDRVRAELAAVGDATEAARAETVAELDRLRRRLREQGVKLRMAKDAALAGELAVNRIRAESEAEVRAARVEAEREREKAALERARAARAVADAEVARQSAREARQADEVRLGLLVDTLDGAVTGLRRELALGDGGPRPADLVRGASAGHGAARVDDPAALDRLLALPSVHLVVDGYNVTKTGYGDLSLSEQRERLNHQLAVLAARTTAEVTVVYDGAGVVAVPTAAPRGVRSLFSDPGVLADDVIRALVAAEPEGRPVVVVTSDRAVADSVRRRGAHPVPSAVLLARLSRV